MEDNLIQKRVDREDYTHGWKNKKDKVVYDKINILLFDITKKLDDDYGNGNSFDIESFKFESDEGAIAYDMGYINALRYVLKIMDKGGKE